MNCLRKCLSLLLLCICTLSVQAFDWNYLFASSSSQCTDGKCGEALVQKDAPAPNEEALLDRGDLPIYHFLMLRDSVRNTAFDAALKKFVTPDSHVLDIGTGTSLLSLMAARAGAKSVTAVEKHVELYKVAQAVVELNGYSDKIKVLNKHSSSLIVGEDMPEKADILVSETLDTYLIGEWFLPTLKHAREHLLKPNAIVIPSSAVVYVQLIESFYGFGKTSIIEGFDLTPFRKFRITNTHGIHSFCFLLLTVHRNRTCSPSTHQSHRAFRHFEIRFSEPEKVGKDVVVTRAGACNAIALWWDAFLDAEKTLFISTARGMKTHWAQGLLMLGADLMVNEGDVLHVVASHNTTSISFSVDLKPKSQQ